jgi:methionyl aminopeptidase
MGERITAISGAPKQKPISKNIKSEKFKNIGEPKTKKRTNVSENNNMELEHYKQAGEIAQKLRKYAREITKPGVPLIELAQKIHAKIEELGAEQAFPVNLSIDDVAAHYHPTLDDETKASGLLKIDIGIHIKGFIADTALTIDLTPDNKHKELIEASEQALKNALELLPQNPSLNQIGETIQNTIEEKGFSPIINLSGHSLDEYEIHAGITIPNYANNNPNTLETGGYAIEPFATSGEGKIYEGPPGHIYAIINPKTPRSPTARKIIEYFYEKYQTLPFSLREVQEKFGPMSRLGMKELEQMDIVHSYPQLIEKSHKPVSQAEHTFVKTENSEIVVTTRE